MTVEFDEPARTEFMNAGADIFRSMVSRETVEVVLRELGGEIDRPGSRSFSPPPTVQALISGDGPIKARADQLIGRKSRVVRAVLFDKSPKANWALGWHQDRTIALKARVDMPGFENWNVKEGVPHVEPPEALLSRMATLRLFLDDWDEAIGPLQIALGSHRLGRIPQHQVRQIVSESIILTATGAAGDILAMRLLALHASARSQSSAHRRVLHLDFSTDDLPMPLEWAYDPSFRDKVGAPTTN